ncbi:hypothetical protein PGT21_036647 [Puccinia graminis f. sp. tritici]|uniref:Uncharacterized protein n=1 Tax=Puccinia graminis f. sp. tritici TaxID=56615 RepID=A0A5B0PNA2_PUCGR|nr:hypothetical protein PGT21_036647 [Puccinia graminis f. sp. tritici]
MGKVSQACHEYEKALEVVCGPPPRNVTGLIGDPMVLKSNGESIRNAAFQSANQTTSTVPPTLAKCLQDAIYPILQKLARQHESLPSRGE